MRPEVKLPRDAAGGGAELRFCDAAEMLSTSLKRGKKTGAPDDSAPVSLCVLLFSSLEAW